MKITVKKLMACAISAALTLAASGAAAIDEAEARELSSLGLMEDYASGRTDGGGAITRGEAAELMCRLMALEPSEALPDGMPFADVSQGHEAAGWIMSAYAAGLIDGYGDGTFRPDSELKTEEAVKLAVSALGYTSMAQATGGWPHGYLAVSTSIGLTKGMAFMTGKAITQADMAKLIVNSLDIPMMAATEWSVNGVKYAVDKERTIRSLHAE